MRGGSDGGGEISNAVPDLLCAIRTSVGGASAVMSTSHSGSEKNWSSEGQTRPTTDSKYASAPSVGPP
eukprot:scaffold329930_cov62-Tisochrysis_lutea.AAC.1